MAIALMLVAGAAPFLVAHADVLPPDVKALADKLARSEERMNAVRARLDTAQARYKNADMRLRALTLLMLKTRQYPDAFWFARAVAADQPAAASVLAHLATQSAAEVQRMGSDAARLRKLYGEANNQLAALQAMRDDYADRTGRLSGRQKDALRDAAVEADALEARLAALAAGNPDALAPLDMVSLTAVLPGSSAAGPAANFAPSPAASVAADRRGKGREGGGVAAGSGASLAGAARPLLPLAGRVAQGFRTGKGATAEGVVLRAAAGTGVVSMVDGEVLYSGPFRKFGGLVIVKTAQGEDILYGGLGSLAVSAGDRVRAAQVVGTLGEDGRLYWEVRRRGRVIDPLAFAR